MCFFKKIKNLLQFTFEKNNLLCKKREKITCCEEKSQPQPDIKWSIPKYEHITPLVSYEISSPVQNFVVGLQKSPWLAPTYLKDLLQSRVLSRILRGHEKFLSRSPSHNYGDECFSSVALRLWHPLSHTEYVLCACLQKVIETYFF